MLRKDRFCNLPVLQGYKAIEELYVLQIMFCNLPVLQGYKAKRRTDNLDFLFCNLPVLQGYKASGVSFYSGNGFVSFLFYKGAKYK